MSCVCQAWPLRPRELSAEGALGLGSQMGSHLPICTEPEETSDISVRLRNSWWLLDESN